MKISRKQAESVFNLIRDEVNKNNSKHIKEVRAYNKKLESDALEKFKKTPEYKALLLIKKTFGLIDRSVNLDKHTLTRISMEMFKIKRRSEIMLSYNQAPVIEVLAIDCKNFKELFEVVKKHYGVNKNIDLNMLGKYKRSF